MRVHVVYLFFFLLSLGSHGPTIRLYTPLGLTFAQQNEYFNGYWQAEGADGDKNDNDHDYETKPTC